MYISEVFSLYSHIALSFITGGVNTRQVLNIETSLLIKEVEKTGFDTLFYMFSNKVSISNYK